MRRHPRPTRQSASTERRRFPRGAGAERVPQRPVSGARTPDRARRRHGALAALPLLLAMTLGQPPAFADTAILDEGRQTRTRPKLVQVAVDGVPIEDAAAVAVDPPSGRELRAGGRYLRGTPQLPVSVGLIGCPGCLWYLEAIGPVFVDERAGRSDRPRHPRRPKARRGPRS